MIENYVKEGPDISSTNKNNDCDAGNFHPMFSSLPNHKDSTNS
jgi:hypothetical protein